MVDKEDKKEVWSMDDLVALTNEIQTAEIIFRGKVLNFQYCELIEKEEPTLDIKSEFETDEEKNEYYMDVGVGRVKAMLDKANNMNPEGATITSDNWSELPSTLRFQIANEVMGVEQLAAENFITG
jgi:hypothetical protein